MERKKGKLCQEDAFAEFASHDVTYEPVTFVISRMGVPKKFKR